MLKEQLARQQHLYWLRKRACLDLIEVFSELYKTEAEQFKQQMGLEEDDFHDKDVQELLGVYDEVKLGLEDPEGDGEGEESEDEDYDDEEELEEGSEDEKEEPQANN